MRLKETQKERRERLRQSELKNNPLVLYTMHYTEEVLGIYLI